MENKIENEEQQNTPKPMITIVSGLAAFVVVLGCLYIIYRVSRRTDSSRFSSHRTSSSSSKSGKSPNVLKRKGSYTIL